MATIFLSYARADAGAIEPLKEALESEGHDIWIDRSNLPEASAWREEIRRAITDRDIFLVAVSRASLRSVECRREFEYARDLGKRIIPAVLDDVQPSAAPPDLADINWIPAAAHDRIEKAIALDLLHLQRHTRFLIAAREWERNKGGVLRGATLEEAEQWLAAAAGKEPAPTEQHHRLIAASRTARKRRRIWAAIGAAASVVAIVTIVIVARNRAASERTTLANRLAGESLALWEQDRFDESMLRAVAAYQAAQTSSAFRALLNAAHAEPQLEVVLHGHRTEVEAVAFDPRGGRLVTAGEDHALHLFDTATWKQVATIPAGTERISQLVFAPDGSFLISGGWDSAIRRWDLDRKRELGPPLHIPRGIIEGLALHPGKRFLAASYSSGAYLWDLAATPPAATELPELPRRRINGVAFNATGTALAAIVGSDTVSCWTFTGGVLTNRRDSGALGAHITALASYGDAFIAGLDNGEIVWLSDDDLTVRRRVPAAASGMILALALSSDGGWLAAGSNAVVVRHEERESPDVVFSTRGSRIFGIGFEPGTARLAASGADPAIYVLDATARQPLAEVVHRGRASIQQIAFDPDGQSVVATTLDDRRFRVRLPSRSIESIETAPPGDEISAVVDGPGGIRVEATKEGVVTVTRDGKATRLRGVDLDWVMNVLFTPRGDLLVAGDNDGRVAAWDAKPLKFLRSWKTRGGAASMAFSPDGKQLAVVDAVPAVITLIDPYGSAVTVLEAECGRSAVYVRDGTKLVTGCDDGSLELLDVTTHERLGIIPDGEESDVDFVNALARHPREDVLAAGTEDGRIVLWRIDPAFWLRRACRRANRELAGAVPGWSGAPLVPCKALLRDAPPDIRRPDVEKDRFEGPRVPLNVAAADPFTRAVSPARRDSRRACCGISTAPTPSPTFSTARRCAEPSAAAP